MSENDGFRRPPSERGRGGFADAESLYGQGKALEARRELAAAARCYERAAALAPAAFALQSQLAGIYVELGQPERALGHFQRALALNPRSVETLVDWATTLGVLHRPAEALPLFRRAIELRPGFALAHNNLGVALSSLGQPDEAIAQFERALSLAPDFTGVHTNLGNAYWEAGEVDRAATCYRRALAQSPNPTTHSNLVYALSFHPDMSPEQLLEEARRWQAHWGRGSNSEPMPAPALSARPPRSLDPERPLRIGYVSGCFRTHVQTLFLLPILRQHDRTRCRIYCYSSTLQADAQTAEHRRWADEWRDIATCSDELAAQIIADDCVDVLVDLNMHLAGNRLGVFTHRPAPVQLTWLAYPGTTGVDAIDYRLTDPHLDPVGAPLPYSEQSLRLPATFWCFQPFGGDLEPGPLPAQHDGHVTFGSLNNFCKTNSAVFEAWGRVLARVPNSRLLLLAPQGRVRHRVRETLRRAGVARERIEFVGYQPRREYLASYQRIDIGLDTFPYGGHTTTLEALWMGVPVVTLLGSTVVGRAGASFYENLSLLELLAASAEHYVELATALARDLPRLDALRQSLRARLLASPLCNVATFTRELEAAFRGAWRAHCERAAATVQPEAAS